MLLTDEEIRDYELEWAEAKAELACLRYEYANWAEVRDDDTIR